MLLDWLKKILISLKKYSLELKSGSSCWVKPTLGSPSKLMAKLEIRKYNCFGFFAQMFSVRVGGAGGGASSANFLKGRGKYFGLQTRPVTHSVTLFFIQSSVEIAHLHPAFSGLGLGRTLAPPVLIMIGTIQLIGNHSFKVCDSQKQEQQQSQCSG